MKKLTTYLLLGLSTALFAQVEYQKQVILNDSLAMPYGVRHMAYGDLDGDGNKDLVTANSTLPKLAWFPNPNGNGDFESLRIITHLAHISAMELADANEDGRLDVFAYSKANQLLRYFPNGEEAGQFEEAIVIDDSLIDGYDIELADLDNDGDPDLYTSDGDLSAFVWYENMGDGSFGPKTLIDQIGPYDYYGIKAIDMDLDGDLDLLCNYNNQLLWYENLDGQGTLGSPHSFSSTMIEFKFLEEIDVDQDGDLDLIIGAERYADKPSYVNTIVWLERISANQFVEHEIHSMPEWIALRAVFTDDFDDDGDLDLISCYSDGFYWRENLGQFQELGPRTLIRDTGAFSSFVLAEDVNSDAETDLVLSAPGFHRLEWYARNNTGYDEPLNINHAIPKLTQAIPSDLDNDGDLDIMAYSRSFYNKFWVENLDGLGHFSDPHAIATGIPINARMTVCDVDGNMSPDLVCIDGDEQVLVYRNDNFTGNFLEAEVLFEAEDAYVLYSGDINGDSTQDLVTINRSYDRIEWYSNVDGLGTYQLQPPIEEGEIKSSELVLVDIDMDNDLDLIRNSSENNHLYLNRNVDGLGTFGPAQIIWTGLNRGVYIETGDIDFDGDLDLAFNVAYTGHYVWIENLDGLGTFGESQFIFQNPQVNGDLTLIDFDQDQDLDVALIYDNQLVVYRNLGDDGFAYNGIVDPDVWSSRLMVSADFNGDSKEDLLVLTRDTRPEVDMTLNWYSNPGILSSQLPKPTQALVYPNPTTDNIRWDPQLDVEAVSVYDLSGKLILQQLPETSGVSLHGLQDGLYLVRLHTATGILRAKVIKH